MDNVRPTREQLEKELTDLRGQLDELRASRDRFRNLIDSTSDWLWEVDRQGTYTYVSSRVRDLLGREPEDLIGTTPFDIMPPAEAERVGAIFREVASRGEPFSHLTNVCLHMDGRQVVMETSGEPVHDADGNLMGYSGVDRDITDRKRTDETLRFLSLITEQVSDAVIATNLDFETTYVNRASEDLFGYSREESLGRSPAMLNADPDAEHIQGDIYRTVSSGGVWKGELMNRRKDGSTFPCEMTIFPLVDEGGNIFAYAGNRRDITKRKRIEEDLLREKELSEGIIDSLPGLFYMFDDKHLLRWNVRFEEVSGYSAEELAEMYGTDFFEGDDRSHIAEKMEQVFREGLATAEANFVTKDGRKIPYFFTGLRKTLYEGKPCLIGLGIDISDQKQAELERRRLEAQVQHTQKLESLGVLAGGIAHDFNNLLMAILGNADLAIVDLPAVSPVRHSLEEIKKASLRAADLAKQMLAYSGKGRFVVEALDLSDVVDEMAQILEVSVSKKAVLKCELGDDLPTIEADATQIRQVVMNLITNASEAIGDRSGTISVTTSAMEVDRQYLRGTYLDENLAEGLYVTLEVADTGCGMDVDTQAKLFDPFFTTKFTGRGLGMAALLGIVRGHRGAIKVDSTVGKGTTVKVLFPAAEGEVASAPKDRPGEADRPDMHTALLVDDSATVRSVGKAMLERLGMTVLVACDGREAVEVFAQHANEIDCVLLDLTMPHMDGEQAFHELRRIRPDVRVIMSSGYNEQEVTQRFVGQGIAGFIHKPYELQKLASVLRRVFEA